MNRKCKLPLTASKKEKTGDIGIKAEDINACDEETKRMREIFNEVILCEDTPEAWKSVIIKMIYKKGDVERADM